MENHLGITWTKGPSSWDPLDFDLGNNILFGRMLYSPPFEISKDGQISSYILSSFEMSESGKDLKMKIDPSKNYSDGSKITANDVALAILRMVLTRPEFPVINAIQGVSDWKKSKTPLKHLPKGIAITSDEIKIHFDSPQRQALFRLSLELFSVIPSRCIDPETSKLICTHPPESGRYKLASGIEFGKNLTRIDFVSVPGSQIKPDKISISYINNENIGEFLRNHPGAIVHTSDLEHSSSEINSFSKNHEVFETPKAWFGVSVLSKYSQLFENENDRLLFRNKFLANLSKHQQEITFDVETSLFTEIMPGYIPAKIEKDLATNALSSKKKSLRWVALGMANDAVVKSLNDTCAELSIQCEKVPTEKYKSADFNAGNIDVLFSKTGFWAKDPLGDLKMLFTPNLHLDLQGIWSDKQLLNRINQAEKSTSIEDLSRDLRDINLMIQNTGQFNVFAHFKYYYLTDSSRSKEIRWIPQSVTEPYPWYLFND